MYFPDLMPSVSTSAGKYPVKSLLSEIKMVISWLVGWVLKLHTKTIEGQKVQKDLI